MQSSTRTPQKVAQQFENELRRLGFTRGEDFWRGDGMRASGTAPGDPMGDGVVIWEREYGPFAAAYHPEHVEAAMRLVAAQRRYS